MNLDSGSALAVGTGRVTRVFSELPVRDEATEV